MLSMLCYAAIFLGFVLPYAALCCAGFADAERASVCGGSHGGFLTGHLMGQYPQRFKCAGLRNPVLNIALMVGVTDIPDWCYVETYGSEVSS
jgi:acylaminoacyl-peptidase